MSPNNQPVASSDNNVSIGGDVVDSVVVAGDNNVVNKQTIVQKFFNIFKSDTETLEQRNRRILLGHVENAWIKGVLDASLHSAALLDLGIKEDPDAVIKYPWAIKKEATNETLPPGTSMLEIFASIGMGRSLLILGAPGSGKTTMLLELARQLVQHAREDVTEPIPMVFNLASWTEKLKLADWLARELNNLYSVPRKTAPDWVKGNKLLLLLDGLDEVRQDSRAKCVDAINEFRKEHGMTSLAVCSRSQDYADLNAKLSFEGAIEVQPLTPDQITEFFNRLGEEAVDIKQALEKDSDLRKMAETPLFSSIMIMAYRDKRDVDILISGDEKARRKHLFDAYINHMFDRSRAKNTLFNQSDVLRWLSWLSGKMIEHNHVLYLLENMQPNWTGGEKQIKLYMRECSINASLVFGFVFSLLTVLSTGLQNGVSEGLATMFLVTWLSSGSIIWVSTGKLLRINGYQLSTIDSLSWNRSNKVGIILGVLLGLFFGIFSFSINSNLPSGFLGFFTGLTMGISLSLEKQQIDQATYPGQRIFLTTKNFLYFFLIVGIGYGMIIGQMFVFAGKSPLIVFFIGPTLGSVFALQFGGLALIQHYTLRFIFARNNFIPWKLISLLNYSVDLIFLRRIGGGYIFIHRLLMEHFAEMYMEPQTSK